MLCLQVATSLGAICIGASVLNARESRRMCSRAVWLLLVVGLVQQPLFGPTPADAGFSLPIRIWKQIEREAKTAGYELVADYSILIVVQLLLHNVRFLSC